MASIPLGPPLWQDAVEPLDAQDMEKFGSQKHQVGFISMVHRFICGFPQADSAGPGDAAPLRKPDLKSKSHWCQTPFTATLTRPCACTTTMDPLEAPSVHFGRQKTTLTIVHQHRRSHTSRGAVCLRFRPDSHRMRRARTVLPREGSVCTAPTGAQRMMPQLV